MPDYKEDTDSYGLVTQSQGDDHGAAEDYSDSKSRYSESRNEERVRKEGRDRDRGRNGDKKMDREGRDRDRDRDRGREKGRDRDKYREMDRDRDHDRPRDRHRDWADKRGRDRDDDGEHYQSREAHRRRGYDNDRDEKRRHRSPSPSKDRTGHRSRSPSQSKKRSSGFDIAPPGPAMLTPAAVSAAQLPGSATQIPGMFPNMFSMATPQLIGTLPIMPMHAMTQQATRHARRVYVGGLPPTANEQSVAVYFSQVMAAVGGNTAGPGDAVVNVYINHEKKFAFVEMRSVEEASNAMALDGVIFEGTPVKVRRPSDYNPSLAATLGPSQPNPNLNLAAIGLSPGSAGVLEGPDRIFVGGLPYYLTEIQIRELLESFGALRGFDLVRDRETGNSKGYAFCVYGDPSVTDIACATLNGIPMGDKTLTVRRANQGTVQPNPEQESVLLHAQQQIALQRLMLQHGAGTPTKVVCLTNAVTPEELTDDTEYDEILTDMRDEGQNFGSLVSVVIPRAGSDGQPSSGVGKVFLEYADVDGANEARNRMNGRKFAGRKVEAAYYSESKFSQGEYDG